jgi:subtilase family serine protease
VYYSFLRRPRWEVVGGTSASTVEMAGLIADADQLAGHSIGDLPAKVYAAAAGPVSGIVDVTAGNNSFGPVPSRGGLLTVPGFSAGAGYDLATGLGTVDAGQFVPALARIG